MALDCDADFVEQNADLWLYPPRSSVTLYGEDQLQSYLFGPKRAQHGFCKRCGIDLVNQVHMRERFMAEVMPIKLRTMEDIDHEHLEIEQKDGWKVLVEPPHVPYDAAL